MKLKNLLVIIPLSLLSSSLLAAPLDSIGVENQNGKKVILHKLDPKDNYYAIGRRYNVAPATVIQFNNNAPLRVGNIVKVPTEQPFVTAGNNTGTQQTTVQNQDASTIQYKVSAGETLYAISRRFNTRVEDIISLNNLKSNSLAPGQILQIKSGPAASAPVAPTVTQAVTPRPADNTLVNKPDTSSLTTNPDSVRVERRLPANRYGLTERNEKGVATWMDDTGLDANKKLVLHRTAPVGTVIKITNPMTNRTTFAKVVGRFTDNEMTKDVIIVMTKNTADALGALDKRFHVNISYGVPNE